MIDFDFYSPTKIYFGSGKETTVGKICKDGGYRKVLIVTGKDLLKKTDYSIKCLFIK